MAQFQEGKTYTTRSACNYDCIFSMKVIKRTAKTIVADVKGFGTKRLRIKTYGDVETVMPLGSYSMAPQMRAE